MSKPAKLLALVCLVLLVPACNRNNRGTSAEAEVAKAANNKTVLVKDRMILETIVNDYMMRRKAKGEFAALFPFEFDYWTSAVPESSPIVVFIYARPPVPTDDPRYARIEAKMQSMFGNLDAEIVRGLQSTVLGFPEFSGEAARGVQVILRIEPRSEDVFREAILSSMSAR